MADSTVVGGADVPFSNNSQLKGVAHTAATTTFTVTEAGFYEVLYSVNYTAGVGAQIAVAVNGTVNPQSSVSLLTATGHVNGVVILSLAAGDVITLRNNSATAITLALAPSVAAQIALVKLN